MPAKRTARNAKQAPRTITAAEIRALVAKVDAAVARAPRPYDSRDSHRDRLFAILMERVDYLQAQRGTYLGVIDAALRQPALLPVLATALGGALAQALRAAKMPHSPLHVGAVMLAYTATVAAWRNDTTADLAKTMRACDRALNILERAAQLTTPRAAARH